MIMPGHRRMISPTPCSAIGRTRENKELIRRILQVREALGIDEDCWVDLTENRT